MNKWLRKAMSMLCCVVMAGTTLTGLVGCFKKSSGNQENSSTASASEVESSSGATTCSHDWEETVIVAATCEKDGLSEFVCSLCGEEKTETVHGEHQYKEETIAVSCMRDGSHTVKCERCGEVSSRTITARATGHNTEGATWTKSTDTQVEDSCTWRYVETTTCGNCQEIVEHIEEYVKHDWAVSITTTATCATAGVKTYQCRDCGETMTANYTDENAHNWVEAATQSATENVIAYECTHNATHTKTVFSATTSTSATVPAAALQEAGEVELQNAAIKMDEAVLNQLDGKDVDLSVETIDKASSSINEDILDKIGDSPVFDFSMTAEGLQEGEAFAGELTVTVPYTLGEGEDPNNIAVWYIKDDGTTDTIAATYSQGYVTFKTNHFSLYSVVRLTPEELCSFYGHDNEVTVIPASCNAQGYTLTQCKVCHELSRSQFTAALTHNYSTTVVAPTCSEKGYTVYTCGNCNDRYIGDYVATIAHTFTDKVKEPTCTAGGYTTHVCSVCNYSFTDTEKAAKGHTYANGVCSVCGRKDPNAPTNTFYLNLVDSLASAKQYYIQIKDWKMNVLSNAQTDVELEFANMVVGFDETGLVGKADLTMTESQTYQGEEMTVNAVMQAVLRDGKIYLYQKMTGDQTGVVVGLIDQEKLFGQAGAAETFAMLKQLYATMEENVELLNRISDGMLSVENSPINGVIQKITEWIYVKTATENGFTFTLDKARAQAIHSLLSTLKVNQLYDNIFGEGSFESLVTYLTESLDKTVAEFEEETVPELAAWGIQKTDLYQLIDLFVNGEISQEGTMVEGFIQENGEMKVYQLVGAMSGQDEPMTLEDYQESIAQFSQMMQGCTLIELVEMMGPQAGVQPEPGGGNIAQKAGSEDEEAEPTLSEMITEILEKLGTSSISFATDKSGVVLAIDINVKDIEIPMEDGNTKLTIVATITPDGDFAGEYDQVVWQAKEFEDLLNIDQPMETEMYTIFKMGEQVFLWSNGRYQVYESNEYVDLSPTMFMEETEQIIEENVDYNGVLCTKKSVDVRNLYLANTDFAMMYQDCHGWWRMETFEVLSTNRLTVYVYENANGDIVGMEYDETQDFSNYYGSASLYFNPATGKAASETQHNYKLVQVTQPQGCEYGKYVYECTVCGASYYETFGDGHRVTEKVELKNGSTTCEDGVVITEYCLKCNETLYERTVTSHEICKTQTKIGTSEECGDIYLVEYGCACGQYVERFDVQGNCIFNHMLTRWCDEEDANLCTGECQYSEHYIHTYRCAVDACAFTYTREYAGKHVEENGVCYYTTNEIIRIDGQIVKEITDKWESHWEEGSGIENAYGGYTTTWTCRLCGEVTEISIRDQYDREIYRERPLDGYKEETVYTGCDYERTFTKDGESDTSWGTQHAWTWRGSNREYCTQYYGEGQECRVCGTTEIDWRAPDNYNYQDHGHNWEYNEDSGLYECMSCNTSSTTGAEGLISIEDMSEGNTLKAGYFNYRGDPHMSNYLDMNNVQIKVIANYQPDGSGVELQGDLYQKQITSPESGYDKNGQWREYREAGIITIDADAFAEAVDNCDEEVETISIVFYVFDEVSNTYLGHAITMEYVA